MNEVHWSYAEQLYLHICAHIVAISHICTSIHTHLYIYIYISIELITVDRHAYARSKAIPLASTTWRFCGFWRTEVRPQ